jgi:hypothetical protein
MNISKRNKKVAISRWSKKHSKERSEIKNDRKTLLLKASICGFLAGDGSVQKRKEKSFYHYQIDFFPDDPLMRNTYITQINKVYKKIPTVKKKNNFDAVRLTSKVVVEDLLKLSKFGIKNWMMPKTLFSIKGAKENWLRSFFSAEAYIGPKSIKIQTVNKKGMLDIVKVLKELGINSKYYEYNPKKLTHSKVFILFINRKEDRMKYLEKIGFWHQKKTKTLSESLYL